MSVRVSSARPVGRSCGWRPLCCRPRRPSLRTEDEILDWTLKSRARAGRRRWRSRSRAERPHPERAGSFIRRTSSRRTSGRAPRRSWHGAVGPLQAIGASSETDKTPAGTYTYFSSTAQFRQRVRLRVRREVRRRHDQRSDVLREENGLCALFRKQFDVPAENGCREQAGGQERRAHPSSAKSCSSTRVCRRMAR